MKALSFVLAFLALNSFADVGLSTGQQYTSKIYYGRVHAWCPNTRNGGPSFKLYNCAIRTINPEGVGYFYTESGVEGDKVILINKSLNRRNRKRLRFNAEEGRTDRKINLWTDTVTQAPLLTYGKNIISYEIRKGRSVSEKGEFEVQVDREPDHQCRDWTYNLQFRCDDYFYVCSEYIHRSNRCS